MSGLVFEQDGLLHVRLAGVIDVAGAMAVGRSVHEYLDQTTGTRMLVDASELQIYSPEGADALLALMKQANPKLERAAFIAPTSQTAALQLGRLVREAGGNNRRIFADAPEAIRWLRS